MLKRGLVAAENLDFVSEKISLDIPTGGFKTLKNKELKFEVEHNR